jgi:hypothetical protein
MSSSLPSQHEITQAAARQSEGAARHRAFIERQAKIKMAVLSVASMLLSKGLDVAFDWLDRKQILSAPASDKP